MFRPGPFGWRPGVGGMRRGAGGQRGNVMVFMLIMQLLQVGLEHIPPVTLASVALLVVVQLGLLPSIGSVASLSAVCFTPMLLLRRPSFALALTTLRTGLRSHVIHLNDYHLYYNAMSWLYKARSEELRRGSEWFVLWVLLAMLGTTLTHTLLAAVITWYTSPEYFGGFADWFDPNGCVVGWSGIVFALKAYQQFRQRRPGVNNDDDDNDRRRGDGLETFFAPLLALLPPFMRYSVWLEIVWIELLVPQVSFLSHCSGVLCGLAMCRLDVEHTLDGPARLLRDIRLSMTRPMPRRQ